MVRWLVAAITAEALLACSSPADIANKVGAVDAGTVQAAPATTPIIVAGPELFTDNEGTGEGGREFEYSWPAQVSAIPALVRILTAKRDTELRDQKTDWAEARADCSPEYASCRTDRIRSAGKWSPICRAF